MNLGPLDAPIAVWMDLPPGPAMGLLALVGVIAGGIVNHVITSWCWYPRPISPWVQIADWKWDEEHRVIAAKMPTRSWADRVPVWGWLRLRRESSLHGSGFWIRPLLIEISLAITLPLMHQLWIGGQLLPPAVAARNLEMLAPWMTLLFFVHAFLLVLMVAATFIDFDERTIPDSITIPGTILGLVLASLTPYVFLPGALATGLTPVTLAQPLGLAAWWTTGRGWVVAIAIWSMWCFALADRRVIMRHGSRRAVEYFFARLVRHPSWKILAGIWVAGVIAISIVFRIGGEHWIGLLSALMGLAVGGGIVWSIRLVGSWAMQMEAMGFGDVTLMAMIGSYIGWQASIAAFFLAPLAAIAIVLVQFVITRDRATPFGPYLCAGTVLTLICWDQVYNMRLSVTISQLGDMLPWLAVSMLGLLGGMLWVSRLVKQRLYA